jgi:hypothetical protein
VQCLLAKIISKAVKGLPLQIADTSIVTAECCEWGTCDDVLIGWCEPLRSDACRWLAPAGKRGRCTGASRTAQKSHKPEQR